MDNLRMQALYSIKTLQSFHFRPGMDEYIQKRNAQAQPLLKVPFLPQVAQTVLALHHGLNPDQVEHAVTD